jgi:hypothetical protein
VYALQTRSHDDYQAALDAWDGTGKKPREKILYVSDFTVEKLAAALQDNLRGVQVIRDELHALVRAFDQYRGGRGADKQFFLSGWAGEPVSVQRQKQESGSVFVPHPFLSVVGCLPPSLLASLRGERAQADGWMDRFLFDFAEPVEAGGEDWRCIDPGLDEVWEKALSQLRSLEMKSAPGGGLRPHFVKLTSCGRKAWERFTADLADQLNDELLPDCLHGPWAKMRGYCARLALIVHQLRLAHREVSGADVDGESLERAAQLVAYYQDHARKVYAMIDADPRIADARRVIKWLSVNRVNRVNGLQGVSRRDIHANVLGSRYAAEEVDGVINLLVRYGYLRLAAQQPEQGRGPAPGPRYEIHPSVFSATRSHGSHGSQIRQPGEEG